MKYKAILFDLDGTLLPMTNETLEGLYLPSLSQKLSEYVKPDLLMKNMWESLSVMMSDSSTLSNEIVFFDAFRDRMGNDLVNHLEPMFYTYYENEFNVLLKGVDDNSMMVEAIKILKEKGYRLVIATNPMFPEIAVSKRIEFSDLDESDFEYVSNYSKHTACKPNVKFYEEVLAAIDLKPEDCLMVGNDAYEDMIVKDLGMDAWLLTDYLIDGKYEDKADWKGTRLEFLEKVKEDL